MNTRINIVLALAFAAGCGPRSSTTPGQPPGGGDGTGPGGNPDPANVGLPAEQYRASQPPPNDARAFQLPELKHFQVGDKA